MNLAVALTNLSRAGSKPMSTSTPNSATGSKLGSSTSMSKLPPGATGCRGQLKNGHRLPALGDFKPQHSGKEETCRSRVYERVLHFRAIPTNTPASYDDLYPIDIVSRAISIDHRGMNVAAKGLRDVLPDETRFPDSECHPDPRKGRRPSCRASQRSPASSDGAAFEGSASEKSCQRVRHVELHPLVKINITSSPVVVDRETVSKLDQTRRQVGSKRW